MLNLHSHLANLLLGQRLKHDLFNHSGVLIIPARTIIDESHLHMIYMHQISISLNDLEEPSDLSQFHGCDLIDRSVRIVRDLFEQARYRRIIPISEIQKHILPIIQHTVQHSDLFTLLSWLKSSDDYTYRHTVAVSILSTLIGKWLQLNDEELIDLTMSAILHDVGKMYIPAEIINKPGTLTDEEFDIVKQHTVYGHAMIKATSGTTHRQALVALQHHERQDGSGYPHGLRSENIDLYSRIVAVADVFHAMSSDRVYRDAAPFYSLLNEMYQFAFGKFDAKIIRLFLDKLMQAIVGNEVRLTDGRTGIIVMINSHDPIQPLVRVGNAFVDLSKCSIQIEEVIPS
ncbi:hypothetical protein BVG16_04145 [Paenibacillus selenitireducens]|uniref:HD-GYP domain-containing protein n=1 Tax=Paenibacillus selenitireducens TaxID=1324314 RepID=A0A1T2XJ93_9BACL|nr:HD-GYP domain-containing protein [Paenibacillus selenitireducens]OPA79951.1 hypothetical protein BVG16_04145 [Paenibacillus selenitireducens]